MTIKHELVVRKSVVVRSTPERAFRVFTEEMAAWWPLATHSVFRDAAAACAMEPREGGRIFERSVNGEESTWGAVLAWQPPSRVAFTWHPGFDERLAGEVEVSFTAEGEGTRVDLVHRGFEKRGADAAQVRENYDTGWGRVLGECFGAYAGRVTGASER